MDVKRLFLDLDGVLADFDRGVAEVTGHHPDELAKSDMWDALADHPNFFGTLQMIDDAQQLWDFCEPYDPTILTGLPRGEWAGPQKRRWVGRMLSREIDVITCWSRDKPKWSAPGHVLVDDRERLKTPWEQKGGRFILHVSADRSIRALRALGL